MKDRERIRRKLKEDASNKQEEKQLLKLFEDLCSGLDEEKSVKRKLESRLAEMLEELEEQAKAVKRKIT